MYYGSTVAVRPETVEILSKPEFFRVGEEYELECQSRGSKPAAEVTWYKGHVAYDAQFVRVGETDILSLKHDSRIFRQSSNPVCGFSTMEQSRLCAGWPTDNWLGSSMKNIQGWMTV